MAPAPVRIEITDPEHPDALFCLREYFVELDARFDVGFDPTGALPLEADRLRDPQGVFVVARQDGRAIGCGGLKLHDDGTAEIKRVWVSSAARGLGLGRRLLADLETRAREHGSVRVRLDSNRALTEAIALYRSIGYAEIAAFNDEPFAHFWFEKRLEPVNPVHGRDRDQSETPHGGELLL